MSANSYIQLWRCMLNNVEYEGLSLEAVVCYCVLADRHRLSEITGYQDNNGRLCVVYPQESLGQILRCKRKKVSKVLTELENYKLITRKHQGMNKADAIYVHALPMSPSGTSSCTSGEHCDVPIADKNNNDDSNTDYNNDIDRVEVCVALMRVWDYDYLISLGSDTTEIVDRIIAVAVDILCSNDEHMYIAGQERRTDEVRATISKLNMANIMFLIQRIQNKRYIHNLDAYIATSLYNSGIAAPG